MCTKQWMDVWLKHGLITSWSNQLLRKSAPCADALDWVVVLWMVFVVGRIVWSILFHNIRILYNIQRGMYNCMSVLIWYYLFLEDSNCFHQQCMLWGMPWRDPMLDTWLSIWSAGLGGWAQAESQQYKTQHRFKGVSSSWWAKRAQIYVIEKISRVPITRRRK